MKKQFDIEVGARMVDGDRDVLVKDIFGNEHFGKEQVEDWGFTVWTQPDYDEVVTMYGFDDPDEAEVAAEEYLNDTYGKGKWEC